MNAAVRRCLAAILVCTVLLISSRLAKADEIKNDAIYAGVAIGAVAAAITVAIVLVVTHKPSITGCATSREGGVALRNDADGKIYVLRGDIAGISAGQRVRVSGKQKKHSDPAEFDVAKLKKTMGTCPSVSGGF